MAEQSETNRFQVDLKGIIDILAHHLYSTPTVFVRELLQNGCDAIRMRQEIEPHHRGSITLEVIEGNPPTLVCTDDGIGLTEAEVHEFLSTVGRSSKRDEFFQARADFIGQFGIGLLSCFTVSETLTLITKSARNPEEPAVKWTASNDGTYRVEKLTENLRPGVSLYLRCRGGMQEMFTESQIIALAKHWGALLPVPIEVRAGRGTTVINGRRPPWERSSEPTRRELLSFSKELLEEEFLDVIPLFSDIGDIQGAAYILKHPVSHARRQAHRVYLKGMLLADENDDILPDWAFFIRAVVNANTLQPTASRESFYENEVLGDARAQLGECIRQELLEISQSDPERLKKLIQLHWFSLKALAVEDDEFFRMIIEWLPFETTVGRTTIHDLRESGENFVRFTRTVDEFHQVASVAAAQDLCIVNGGYTYDSDLMERAGFLLDDFMTERLNVSEMTQAFEELTLDERNQVHDFLRWADVVLRPFKCEAEVRRFSPVELPVFFLSNESAGFLKSVEKSKEISDSLFSGVLDGLSEPAKQTAYSCVCFNLGNEQIAALTQVKDPAVIQRCVELLYLQALFFARVPLSRAELNLLNRGIGEVIAWGIHYSSAS